MHGPAVLNAVVMVDGVETPMPVSTIAMPAIADVQGEPGIDAAVMGEQGSVVLTLAQGAGFAELAESATLAYQSIKAAFRRAAQAVERAVLLHLGVPRRWVYLYHHAPSWRVRQRYRRRIAHWVDRWMHRSQG